MNSEVDIDGYQFITDSDVQRLHDDWAPTDPVERDRYFRTRDKYRAMRTTKKLETRNSRPSEIMTHILGIGLPIDVYKFEPSEKYSSIEDCVGNKCLRNIIN